MSAADISTLLIAAGGFLVVLGGGGKYLLSRMDAKNEAAAIRMDAKNELAAKQEDAARTALSERLQVEISHLREELQKVQGANALYLRRIYQLESFIHRQPGIDIPMMDGWPPV